MKNPIFLAVKNQIMNGVKWKVASAFFVFSMATATTSAQVTQTSAVKKVPIEKAFKEITERTGYNFFYEKKLINPNTTVPLSTSGDINAALNSLRSNSSLDFKINGNQVIVVKLITIKGIVKDAGGNPVEGATVTNKRSGESVKTDANGNFSIKADIGDEIEIRQLNYFIFKKVITDAQDIYVTLANADIAKNDSLRENQIDAVVITGYQRINPNKTTGSFSSINMAQVEKKGQPNIINALEGMAPSLVLSNNPNDPGSKELTIRGVATLQGPSAPLIVVDGFQYEGDIKSINPYEVESITLLKDAAAASIYGAKSGNGVIVISTKRGRKGATQFRYSSNLTFSSKSDLGYLMNRVNSSDLVDIQKNYVESLANVIDYQRLMETNSTSARNNAYNNNRVYYLYASYKYGRISLNEYNAQLAALRTYDNTADLEKTYLQSPFLNQQNLSVIGGGDVFKYRTSLNYTQEYGNFRGSDNRKLLYDFVSTVNFSPKISLDFGTNLTLNNNKGVPTNFYGQGNGLFSLSDAFNISSYDRFYDENGNPLSVFKPFLNLSTNNGGRYGGKDPYEIQRLKSKGLLDETYFPANDFNKYSYANNNWSARFQGLLKIQLLPGLTGNVGGQFLKGSTVEKTIANSDSWEMTQLINNTTPLTYTGDKTVLNIPIGARIKENRGENTSYVFRGQLDYVKEFGDHYFNTILGSEIQSIKNSGSRTDRFGYNSASNLFLPTDYYRLSQDITGVYTPSQTIAGGIPFDNSFYERENRFFSLYSNALYSFADKYILTGSARIDQSNLFGTDKKYRYKPFWSVGAKWRVGKEDFMNGDTQLDLRASYGITGNIANKYGPYDIATNMFVFRAGYAPGLSLISNKVNDLRWERTGTTNLGLDTKLLNKKIDLSFDFYRKRTIDVLADMEADPTLGSGVIAKNNANITNNGYEIALTTHNFKTTDFTWDTFANFRLNDGKVTDVFFNSGFYGAYFYAGNVLNMKNNAPNSIYVFDYAGVSSDGSAQIRKADGTVVKINTNFYPDDLKFEDLKAAGPTLPKYVAALNNNLMYKNFSLSFLFVYQGGHVMLKDSYNGEFLGRSISRINADAAKSWKNPGDENTTDIPKINSLTYSSIVRGSTKNILPADFIRLRDVILSYTLPNSFSQSLKLKEFTVNVRGNNLYLWTKNEAGIDPESQGLGYRYFPAAKSFSLGFNLIF